MIEFVTEDGDRLEVNPARKCVKFPNGEVRTICQNHDGGYVVYYHGNEIFGSLRVKAGSRTIPERKAIDIPLLDAEMHSEALKALASRKAALYFGTPHKVVAVMSGIPHSTATLMPVTVQTEWTSIPIYEPLPEAIPGYRIECLRHGTDSRRCMYRFVSLDEANA